MDVLRPSLIYIDGRCYRINDPDSDVPGSKPSGVAWDDQPSNYGYECAGEEPCDGDPDEEFEILPTDSGRYKTSFHVARVYYAPIIGTKGNTRKRLEEETRTVIKVPRQPQDTDIIITGSSRTAVTAARRRILNIILSYRRKQQFTHFLSIPMRSPTVKERFIFFKQQVLAKCTTRGLEESIFQNPDKLHLTLCTMVLMDNIERSKAVQVLESCKREVVDALMEGHSITILLSGIEYMNDDPSEVDVLYARVHADEILQTLCDNVVDYCSNKGIVDKQFEKVKLHVTAINTRFRETTTEHGKDRETFNARPILEMFHDFEFGEVTIESIHLSTRYTTSKTDSYYQATAQVSLYL